VPLHAPAARHDLAAVPESFNAGLPAHSLPARYFQQIPGLMGRSFTIARLGAVESLLSGVVAGRH